MEDIHFETLNVLCERPIQDPTIDSTKVTTIEPRSSDAPVIVTGGDNITYDVNATTTIPVWMWDVEATTTK